MSITVGIPFYNAASTLPGAIRSVFAQSRNDWELLLVDDGSTDGSLDIARSIRDPRVRVLADGRNRKLPYRLNQIAREARYDLVARMDADDLMFPHRLERQHGVFDDPRIVLVAAGACRIDANNRLTTMLPENERRPFDPVQAIHKTYSLIHPTVMARREWLLAHPYDETLEYSEDYELWVRCALSGALDERSLHVIPETLLFFREAGESLLRKILLAERVDRSIVEKYGPEILGKDGTKRKIRTRWIRTQIIRILGAVGLLDFSFRNFSRSLRDMPSIDIIYRNHWEMILDAVLATELPVRSNPR